MSSTGYGAPILYPIQRWDAVVSCDGLKKRPVVHVKADSLFTKFAEEHNFIVLLDISGTNTIYDGQHVVGIVDVPWDRPNYFEDTGRYVVQLQADWHGYPHPSSLGEVMVSGIQRDQDAPAENPVDVPQETEFYVGNDDDERRVPLKPGYVALIIGIAVTIVGIALTVIICQSKNQD